MEIILKLLDSDEERYEKQGLQKLCDLLERGHIFNSEERFELDSRLSKFERSPYILVRRWLYKVIGLYNDKYYLPLLIGKLSTEDDLENQSWIVAALYRLTEGQNAYKLISKSEISSTTLISAGYFQPQLLPKRKENIIRIFDANEALSLKWFSLLYGNSLPNFSIDKAKLKDFLTRLNLHDNNQVAEYSIWALHKSSEGSFADSLILPHQISAQAPNVRRWLYRLITKDKKSIGINYDLIKQSINSEKDISARDGLASGLGKFAGEKQIVELYSYWFSIEKNSFVRIQLLLNIAANAKTVPQYRKILSDEIQTPFDQISKQIAYNNFIDLKEVEVIQTEINFSIPNSTQMKIPRIDNAKFKVSVSFPGEKRTYVQETVDVLSTLLDKNKIFYDAWYEAQLARPNLDILLQDIYHNRSELIVVFLCKEYETKPWCGGIEWKSIRDLMNKGNHTQIMLMSFDFVFVKGTFPTTDGLIDLDKRTPTESANLIFQRLQTL